VQQRGSEREPFRCRVLAARCTSGPQASIPYSRTRQMAQWMVRSLVATLMHRDTNTGSQVRNAPKPLR
jgi:hypothetical protein